MINFPIRIKEEFGVERKQEILKFGIPFPKNKVFNLQSLNIVNKQNQLIDFDLVANTHWPDGSIKWVNATILSSSLSNQEQQLKITDSPSAHRELNKTPFKVTEDDLQISIDTGSACFTLNKSILGMFYHTSDNTEQYRTNEDSIKLIKGNNTYNPSIHQITHKAKNLTNTSLQFILNINGIFTCKALKSGLHFSAKLTFSRNSAAVIWSFTIHNPNAAKHSDGLWDLGDPNSLIFDSLECSFISSRNDSLYLMQDPGENWINVNSESLHIYQHSSGGENWQSPVHKNAQGIVPISIKGAELNYDNSHSQYDRINPSIKWSDKHHTTSVYLKDFWQNFPKSFNFTRGSSPILSLFPEQFELQGGEKKTHNFIVNYDSSDDALTSFQMPLKVQICPQWIKESEVLSAFQPSFDEDKLSEIIQQGLDSPVNFFAKREALDEFGWRNFGEIYADHEADNHNDESIFVSHYNNQYDPLFGFLTQYLYSGDKRWFELAQDLAAHIKDIDIYHTTEDRDEYNGGLFWHTDHYLDAETSTHRTFSKHHTKGAYDGHQGGGGPGGQHCYTSGLMLHHFLTGSESSKASVLSLCQWITNLYEGTGTVLELLMGLKNRNRVELKSVLTNKYPLDRGTGNYIVALLDSLELTQDLAYLNRIESIIRNTVHPCDDIQSRRLNDVELTWFYTVFFQAVGRYLLVKSTLEDFDDAFYYARDVLLHYADWMLVNEQPYLEKPEILEFPNHTWTAQDIRKANVLFYASYFSSDSQSSYTKKANEFIDYIYKNLKDEKTSAYTRILAILMQNYGPHLYFNNNNCPYKLEPRRTYSTQTKDSNLKVFWNFSKQIWYALKNFSIRKEVSWLTRRSEKAAKYFSKQKKN